MAWLQNLTGQAEKILNKIDQKAANVLNDVNYKPKQDISKVLEDPEMITTTTDTHFTSDMVNISNEGHSNHLMPKIVFNEYSKLNIEDSLENLLTDEFTESTNSTSPESNLKTILKDKSSPVGTESMWDDTKKSTSSKSESALHSFSSAEDIQKYIEKISKLEFENEDLSKQILNIQHMYSEIRNENSILKNNLERANDLVNTAECEMEQYKARAHRILQEKEEMISLKAGNKSRNMSEDNIYITYNEELKNELKFQQEKNEELKEKISNLTSELRSLQQQYVVMQNMLQHTNLKTETTLHNERRMLMSLDEELKVKSQELKQSLQELSQKNCELLEKSDELAKLRIQIKQRSAYHNNEELECRIKNLTHTLMLKQNKIETITSERNALRIQLEKLENEYHKNLAVIRNSQQKIVHINDTDDVKLQIPQLMRVSPLDAGVTRRVKHAYTSLDALSIRTGVFLRRYPVVRVFVFSYMVLLHLWVLIILLNYAPNMK